jgi:NADH-quinone oxidoreductase subunit J
VTQVEVVFWIFAVVAVGSALLCITRRSPVASALWLVSTMFAISAMFLLLDAQFIAAIQVLVYAGVIMLLNLGGSGPSDRLGWIAGPVMFAVAGLLMAQLWVVGRLTPPEALMRTSESVADLAETQGIVGMIGEPLFRVYVVPFEITSVLLLAAIVGAVVLAKRRL